MLPFPVHFFLERSATQLELCPWSGTVPGNISCRFCSARNRRATIDFALPAVRKKSSLLFVGEGFGDILANGLEDGNDGAEHGAYDGDGCGDGPPGVDGFLVEAGWDEVFHHPLRAVGE